VGARVKLRFYIDPETREPYIYNHGVTEQDVEEVLLNRGEERRGRNGSRVAIGQAANGRYLQVILVPGKAPMATSSLPLMN
jgi:hypothetical protein